MDCEKCERLMIELQINSETIARVAQDNRMMRSYIMDLEEKLGIVREDVEKE